MAKELTTSNGVKVLVDDDWYDLLSQFKWHLVGQGDLWYVQLSKTSAFGKRIRLHRVVTSCPKGKVVDHINGNTLDNRTQNLRICTVSENVRNRKASNRNITGMPGVMWEKRVKKWEVRHHRNGKAWIVGYYDTIFDAAVAYIKSSKDAHGTFASSRGLDCAEKIVIGGKIA